MLAKDPVVRHTLAELDVKLAVARLLYERVIWMVEHKIPAVAQTAMFKMFMTELGQELVRRALDVIGPAGLLRPGSKWSVLRGLLATGQQATIFHTFGAGGNELMRNLIAIRGYGLPSD